MTCGCGSRRKPTAEVVCRYIVYIRCLRMLILSQTISHSLVLRSLFGNSGEFGVQHQSVYSFQCSSIPAAINCLITDCRGLRR